MPEIARDPQPTEHRKHAAPEHCSDENEQHVYSAVGELAELAVRVHERQPAPERHDAEKVQPECVVLRGARAQIHPEREQRHEQAEVHGDELADFPVVYVFGAKEERHQIHAHVPQRHRNRHEHERESITPQQDGSDGERAELHHDPAPIDEDVKITVGLVLAPIAECHLSSEYRQRHHHNREGRHDASRNVEMLLLEEPMREQERDRAIEDRRDAAAPPAERVPAEGHE